MLFYLLIFLFFAGIIYRDVIYKKKCPNCGTRMDKVRLKRKNGKPMIPIDDQCPNCDYKNINYGADP